jgi:hypothetical protein
VQRGWTQKLTSGTRLAARAGLIARAKIKKAPNKHLTIPVIISAPPSRLGSIGEGIRSQEKPARNFLGSKLRET